MGQRGVQKANGARLQKNKKKRQKTKTRPMGARLPKARPTPCSTPCSLLPAWSSWGGGAARCARDSSFWVLCGEKPTTTFGVGKAGKSLQRARQPLAHRSVTATPSSIPWWRERGEPPTRQSRAREARPLERHCDPVGAPTNLVAHLVSRSDRWPSDKGWPMWDESSENASRRKAQIEFNSHVS